jgi:hypothetical protein
MKKGKVDYKVFLVAVFVMFGLIGLVFGFTSMVPSITTPSSGAKIAYSDLSYNVNVSVTGQAGDFNFSNMTVYYSDNGVAPWTFMCQNYSANASFYECNWSLRLNGTYTLNISVYNNTNGNYTHLNSSTVDVYIDTIYPTVTGFNPSAGLNTSNNSLEVYFTATDYNLSSCDIYLYKPSGLGGVNHTNLTMNISNTVTLTFICVLFLFPNVSLHSALTL